MSTKLPPAVVELLRRKALRTGRTMADVLRDAMTSVVPEVDGDSVIAAAAVVVVIIRESIVGALTDEDRIGFFAEISKGYCTNCGHALAENETCACKDKD